MVSPKIVMVYGSVMILMAYLICRAASGESTARVSRTTADDVIAGLSRRPLDKSGVDAAAGLIDQLTDASMLRQAAFYCECRQMEAYAITGVYGDIWEITALRLGTQGTDESVSALISLADIAPSTPYMGDLAAGLALCPDRARAQLAKMPKEKSDVAKEILRLLDELNAMGVKPRPVTERDLMDDTRDLVLAMPVVVTHHYRSVRDPADLRDLAKIAINEHEARSKDSAFYHTMWLKCLGRLSDLATDDAVECLLNLSDCRRFGAESAEDILDALVHMGSKAVPALRKYQAQHAITAKYAIEQIEKEANRPARPSSK